MKLLNSLRHGLLLLALVSAGLASDLTGAWTAQIDTPVGRWAYVYTFKSTPAGVEGVATLTIDGGARQIFPCRRSSSRAIR